MKKWTYILAVVAVLALGVSNTGWSIQSPGIGSPGIGSTGIRNPGIANPGIRNPAGISTVPPSSIQSGLVTSPNPFARTGNDQMTGNVRGGKSYRGGLPYRSNPGFWGYSSTTNEAINLVTVGGPLTRANTLLGPTPDTATLDSFLRDSAGWEDFGTYSGKYGDPQYYVRKYPVPRATPGRPGVFNSTQSKVAKRPPDVYGLEVLDVRKRTLLEEKARKSAIATRTMPLTPEEITMLASGQTRVRPKNEPLVAEQYQKQMDQMRLDLMNLRSQKAVSQPPTAADAEKEDLLSLLPQPGVKRPGQIEGRVEILDLAAPIDRAKRPDTQAELLSEMQKAAQEDTEGLPGSDMLDKGALDKLLESYTQKDPGAVPKPKEGASAITSNLERLAEQIASLKQQDTAAAVAEPLPLGVKETDLKSTAPPATGLDGYELPTTELPSTDILPQRPGNIKELPPDGTQDQPGEVTLTETEKLKDLSDHEMAVRAKQIRGRHKSSESFSQARFEQYMAEGQANLKQGKYYDAASAFARASAFDSKDPAAQAGRGLALFGAGEYMSGALFLSRAIEMSDEYARSKIDLVATMGDADKLETRIADAEEWLERSCAPELEFLLAYMYYHSGRLEPAKQAIESAEKEMPKSKAIKRFKEVIAAAPKPPKAKK